MSDASEVKRHRVTGVGPYRGELSEVVLASDHDRIVADLRIKIRSLNLEIETRAKPTVEKLKNEITNLKAEVERLKEVIQHDVDKVEAAYSETIARQARAIEILKNCILKEDHRCGIWREGREALELAAIEQGEGT